MAVSHETGTVLMTIILIHFPKLYFEISSNVIIILQLYFYKVINCTISRQKCPNMDAAKNDTVEETFKHYFLYNGSIIEVVINYTLICLFTIGNHTPWGGCLTKRNIFINVHTSICILLQVLCWVFLDAYGVSLVWSGQFGLIIFVLFCWVIFFDST